MATQPTYDELRAKHTERMHSDLRPNLWADPAMQDLLSRMAEGIEITLELMHRCNQTHTEGGPHDYMDGHDTGLSGPLSILLKDLLDEARKMLEKNGTGA